MADWNDFRRSLEDQPVAQPPLSALRERRRRRQQRKAIAATFAMVLVGSATGLAVLGETGKRNGPSGPPVAAAPPTALSRIVNGAQEAPPKDYEDYVVTDVDFVTFSTGWAIGLRCVGDTCDVASWRTDDAGRTWSAPVAVATKVPRSTFHDEDPRGGGARSIRMVDKSNGFAFNPDLYVTRDGGRTWRRTPRPTKVAGISVEGTSVWVTERGCAKDVDCDLVVRAGTVENMTALRTLDVPETNAGLALVRRSSEKDGYLVAWDAPEEPKAFFSATNDGGKSWQRRTMPCPDATAVSLTVSPEGSGVWMVCTAGEVRTAYASSGGAEWERIDDPPAEGVVTDLVVTGNSALLLATQTPGRIHRYSNGAWTTDELPKAYGYANLDVIERTNFYAMGDAGDLWSVTGTSRTWERHTLPPAAQRAAPPPPPPPGLGRSEGVSWTGLSFYSATDGVALGRACARGVCTATVARSGDRGSNWQAVPATPLRWAEGSASGVSSVAFADEDNGWLYGPGLWSTHDGGRTWHEQKAGTVTRLEPSFATVWALADGKVLRGSAGKDDLKPLAVQPKVSAGADLAVRNEETAFVVGEVVSYTNDSGATWEEHEPPCARASASAFGLAGLWLVCAAETDTGQQRQAIGLAGTAWHVTPLPGTGRALGELVAVSDRVAFRTGANRGLLATRDGGRSWQATPVITARVAALSVRDGDSAWAIAGNALYRTSDGVAWERVGST